jgi:outer membrane protein
MIQKINLVISSLALIGVAILFTKPTSSGSKMAYVNTRKLVESHKNMKVLTTQYQNELKSSQEKIEVLNNELEQEVKQYEEKRDKMTYEERAKREQKLAVKQQEIAQYYEKLQNQSRLADDKRMQALVSEINSFLFEYGEEHGYQVILAANGSNIAYADKALDITDEVIEALNDLK